MIKTKQIHISELQQGYTVVIDGEMETVSSFNIKNSFTGMTYKGNPYRETNGMVEAVLFPRWYQGNIIGYHHII